MAVIVHRDLKPGNVLIASERGADLPQIKLADFGVSLLTGEGSGPVGLAPPRKPSSGSLRGAVLPPAAASATGSATAPSSESLSLTRDLPAADLYSVGQDDDDGADTNSIPIPKYSAADVGAQSLDGADLLDTGPVKPVVAVNVAALAAESATSADLAVAASLDAADARTMRPPSQGSLSRMLAAPDDSVVVAGLLTQTDTLIGTPMYMAPELWNTGSHRAEPLSDIFSVGVIAFELLTGRMPFGVPPVMSRANDEPIYISRLAQVRPDLDPRLIALVDSCLSLTPDSRPRASELTRRLIELGAQLPSG